MSKPLTKRRPAERHAIATISLAALLALPVSNASADSLSDLKSQIEALQSKIAQLEAGQKKLETTTPTSSAVTAGAKPGSFKLPGSDTSVKFGGYVKLDAIYSSRSAGANSQADLVLVPGAIPVGAAAANEKNQLKLHARQTRLNMLTHTPTPMGDFGTFLEIDFFGSDGNEVVSNSNNIRMRHAIATLGKLTAGQTWSTFMDPGSLPETLDFGGPVGEAFIRQAQVRWTEKFEGGALSIALENPESFLSRRDASGSYTTLIADDDRFPDVVAKLDLHTSMGRFAVSGMARNLRVDAPAGANAVEARDDAWAGALGFYGVIPTTGKDTLQFSLIGGNGLGRYVGQAFFMDADVDEDGKIHLNPQWGAIVSYRHFWTDALRSTFALSAAGARNPDQAGNANRKGQTAHANLIWSPAPGASIGLEIIHGHLEKEDGRDGNLNRLQGSVQYAF